MKNIAFAFLPLIIAGFMLPGEQCNLHRTKTAPADGPYILYTNNKIYVHQILEEEGVLRAATTTYETGKKGEISLLVGTDIPGKFFPVKLKSELEPERTEYNDVKKQFIISDIEGNFGAFRQLLQAGGVIDTNFKWTFGNGHLVLTGDFVDRGTMVNEVLWLIYSLEDQAKAAGGYVHYVLGNHEIMNMSGDLRYVHAQYLKAAALLNTGFTDLYGPNSELGRWLRTKNVMEKIGDILFVHGGVSAPVNMMELSTSRLNKMVRPHYADSLMKFKQPELEILYSDLGPFWYRGYYGGADRAHMSTIDSTLRHYKVKKIATGHTVIADTISALMGGKLINTDVHHLKGHTEALMEEEGIFYRVLPSGEKKRFL